MSQVILSEAEWKAGLKKDIDRLTIVISNLKLNGPDGEVWFNSHPMGYPTSIMFTWGVAPELFMLHEEYYVHELFYPYHGE